MSVFGKIHELLTPPQRRSAAWLLIMMLIGMLLETLGIGLVIPVLGLLTAENAIRSYPTLAHILPGLGNPSREQLVIGGMVALVALYVFKAMFLAWLAWNESRFAYEVQANLSQRLFTGYLRQPWTFHLQRNSAQLIRNATTEIGLFTHNCLLPGMLLIAESLVLVGVGALLLWIEPLGALSVVSALGVAAWAFQRLTRRHILRWGQARQYHDGMRVQHLQQGLGGAKDVKVLGREEEFFEQYRIHNVGSASVSRRQNALRQLPRLWLELLAVVGLAALVLAMLGQGKPIESLIPTLGLFAAAAFRLMPSTNRILGAAQSLRFGLPALDTLQREIQVTERVNLSKRGAPLPLQQAIVLDNVTYRYPNAANFALNGLSMELVRGTSVGFVGGSGAGKSTLVDVILGLLEPQSGKVEVDDVDIQTNLRGWQDQIGYVPQSIFLTDDTLRRNVAFGLPEHQINDAAVNRAVRAAQLQEFVEGLPQGINTVVGERGVRLSGGQRQRIGIARALYHDPPVLVLDEATSSLDTETEKGVMDAVNAFHGDKTLLIVAHRLSTVSQCDWLFRLEEGRVVEKGSFEEVAKIKMASVK
jgi:ATP-binding cassette, subfamily B, bacterial PglK